jgi:glc operon protein GlcG
MRRIHLGALPALLLVAAGAAAETHLATKKVLSLDAARAVAGAAEAEAKKSGAGGAIAVVDDGGHLLTLVRLDGTFAAAPDIATGKARSAARFQKPTKDFEDAIKAGRGSLVANPELLPLQGGVPIVVDGQVVGAVGVAGAKSAQQDDDIARVAAAALSVE